MSRREEKRHLELAIAFSFSTQSRPLLAELVKIVSRILLLPPALLFLFFILFVFLLLRFTVHFWEVNLNRRNGCVDLKPSKKERKVLNSGGR